MKVYVIADFLSEINKTDIRKTCAECGFEAAFYDSVSEADGRVSDGNIIYCTNERLLPQMKELKWVHSSNAGVEPFIRTGLFGGGKILLTNSSGAYGLAISEHIIMVTLMLMRRMPEYLDSAARHEWHEHLAIRSIAGSNIAIVGTGNLGRTAAEKFRALGAASITGFNRSGRSCDAFDRVYRFEEFADRIAGTDLIVICVPGTPETVKLMDAEKIAAIPDKAYFINVGRGSTVDQDALINALNENRLAGAALDVMEPEPLPQDHPLWTAKNIIITPHCSGDMGLEYTIDRTVEFFIDNLKRYSKGEKLINLVDISAGY
ncbi:MAG: D-2-hydroxyacid dehydrogenase [Mogibacterium sp.]|nr:D-2-hydroxyacid dehydrogenase [Mogibacterium sp.]